VNEPAQDVIFEFGGFALDPRRQTLHRRSDGQPLDLTPRVFATLLHLVAHAGQLVDKRALLAAVWPKAVVEESSLTQAIHVLRRALGEQPDDHRFIVTVPGRGYRFVADVATRPRPEAEAANRTEDVHPPAGRRRGRLALAAGLAVLLAVLGVAYYAPDFARRAGEGSVHRAQPAIAVLPFVDLSPAGDYAYFSHGLAEEVLNLLAGVPGLTVIARTSSFSFKGQDVDVATIARRLKVGYVLEGSVRRDGQRVRVTAQLIDARDSSHLWSASYDRELDDVFAVQSGIAGAVASALQARLVGPAESTAGPPRSGPAYDDFLRGQFFYHRRGPGDLSRALDYYERSVALDPQFARGWAGVAAIVYLETVEGRMPREAGLPRLLEAATRAVALDPHIASGHLRLAHYYWLVGDHRQVEEHWQQALTLEPTNPLVLSVQAGAAAHEGRLDEAIELQRRVAAADPLSATTVGNLGHMLFTAGRLEEARVELVKAIELSPGSNAEGTVGQILVLQGKLDAALVHIERSTPGPDREQGLALVYQALGRTADADAALVRLTAMSVSADPFRLAEVYAHRGDAEAAFRWLELATRPTDPVGVLLPASRNFWEMQASPWLVPLHADPRWAAWVRESG
jgi:TolB-like protein/DNA-binding winged helix-turn-helix (wHTH) protein/Flp pilus assembly protein TadD